MVTLTAVPAEGYQFEKWSGDIDDNLATDETISIVMNKTHKITADFIQQYTINIDISSNMGGTATIATSSGSLSISTDESSLSAQYPSGTTIELSANAAEGYSFEKWSGDIGDNIATDTTIYIDVDSARNIIADFVPLYTINVDISSNIGGTATIATSSGSLSTSADESSLSVQYPSGTTVDLFAVAAEGYNFDGWTGDITGLQSDVSFVLDSPKTITAEFSVLPSNSFPWDWAIGGGAGFLILVLLLVKFLFFGGKKLET